MKRFISIILIITILNFCFVSCGDKYGEKLSATDEAKIEDALDYFGVGAHLWDFYNDNGGRYRFMFSPESNTCGIVIHQTANDISERNGQAYEGSYVIYEEAFVIKDTEKSKEFVVYYNYDGYSMSLTYNGVTVKHEINNN